MKAAMSIGTMAIDAMEAFFVVFMSPSHTTSAPRRMNGCSGNKLPAPVATPLPPLNLRVTGKTCPRTAAAAHAYATGRSEIMMIATGMAPLSASRAKTKMPYFVPSARATLLAPGLPEPTVVMSTPFDFAMRIALGNIPHRYATTTARIAKPRFMR